MQQAGVHGGVHHGAVLALEQGREQARREAGEGRGAGAAVQPDPAQVDLLLEAVGLVEQGERLALPGELPRLADGASERVAEQTVVVLHVQGGALELAADLEVLQASHDGDGEQDEGEGELAGESHGRFERGCSGPCASRGRERTDRRWVLTTYRECCNKEGGDCRMSPRRPSGRAGHASFRSGKASAVPTDARRCVTRGPVS